MIEEREEKVEKAEVSLLQCPLGKRREGDLTWFLPGIESRMVS